jgi:hypothetical protein
MLNKMIFSMKRALFDAPCLTGRVMMGFKVGIVRCRLSTVHTARLGLLAGNTGPMEGTYPLLEWEMKCFLVALPIVFSAKCLRTKRALVWCMRVYSKLFFNVSTLSGALSTRCTS